MCSTRCNSNDAISVFEILARELRATLLSNLSSRCLRGLTAVHVGGGAARLEAAARPAGPGRIMPGAGRLEAAARPAGPGRVIPSAARLEAAARPAGPGRASRRGTERSSVAKSRGRAGLAAAGDLAATGNRATAGDLAASRQKSGGPQENLGTTTHAFTDVN